MMRRVRDYTLARGFAARYAQRNMSAVVAIGRMGEIDDQDDPTKASRPHVLRVVYCGKARLYSVGGGGGPQEFGDGLGYISSSYISIPINAATCWTQVDDMIEVLKHPDPDTVGRCFRVMDVDGGGELPVVRRHTVTSIQRSPQWTWPSELLLGEQKEQP